MSVPLTDVLEFLASLHTDKKSAYATVNVHRSMLSKTLSHVDGHPVGQNPLVKSLLSGCYNLNPPKPKYDSTWDPEVVIRHISSLGNNVDLSLMQRSQKSVTLLALATLLRVSELASITFESVAFVSDGVKFSLSKPRKAQHSGPLQSLFVARLPDASCCPVNTLNDYIARTISSRSAGASVFVSVRAQFRAVTANTVSRWIREFIGSAGVDTSVFGSHSTRGTAASKAAASGVAIDSILRAGHWARESTFRRHYQRECEASIASQVLSTA